MYQLIITANESKSDLGQQSVFDIIINWIFIDKDKPTKYYKLTKIQMLLLLEKLISNKHLWQNKPPIEINPFVFMSLFNDDLKYTKHNVLYENYSHLSQDKQKEKIYIETIYDLLLKIFKLTNDQRYLHTLETLFHDNKLLSAIDSKIYKTKETNSILEMLFKNKSDYTLCSVPSMSLLFLIKHIINCPNGTKDDMYLIFKSLISKALYAVKKVFKEIKECKYEMVYKVKYRAKGNERLIKKKDIYNECKKRLEEFFKNKEYNEEIIINALKDIIKKHNECNKQVTNGNNENEININDIQRDSDELLYTNETNGNENNLNDSYGSCKSTKSVQRLCNENKEKKFQPPETTHNTNKRAQTLFNYYLDANDININMNNNLTPTNNKDLKSSQTLFYNTNSNYNEFFQKEPIIFTEQSLQLFDLSHVTKSKQVCFFPTTLFIKTTFAIFFKNVLFYDNNFVKMQKYFKYYIEHLNNNKTEQHVNIENYPQYPSIIKNYTPTWLFYNGLFMRKEFDFFTNEFFTKTHSYYIEQAKQLNINTMFQRKCNDDCIDIFVEGISNEEAFRSFPCELITNKNVIFGEIRLCNSYIYFKNKNKEHFLKNKTIEEKEKFLLCSYETDLSKRNKRILIFKADICEIINRRFLYQFQACEIFLENGKSYFFNLFSEEKKIEFFSALKLDNTNENKIVTDLKGYFRKKEYSKLWLQGDISNLQYLLFINKYASRSYNDTNQYPVMPWLKLKNNYERNLLYSTVAQTETQRDYLVTKYDMSFGGFKNHFNIHFSNSSFVIYYLVRINPFTNGQITLQNGKFDSPNRQFSSIEDCLNIFERSNDSRELIPHFFISQEFFYNYNCNFYGFRERTQKIVHELTVFIKEQKLLNSKCPNRDILPITYITQNERDLNSQYVREHLHYFINNIFGSGQVGKREDCNTFDKYCYQEMINLHSKIEEYKSKKMEYADIKEKIDRKINKVLSFGQTPYKIFEVPHPPSELKQNQIDNNNNTKTEINNDNKNQKIIFLKISHLKDKEKQPVIYIISTSHNNNELHINVKDINLKEIKKHKYTFACKIKLLKKLFLFNNSSIYSLQYNPKFSLIDLNLHLFIICRFTDNSFIIYDTDNMSFPPQRILTESYITTLCKCDNTSFLTGHFNGKIILWNMSLNNNNNNTNTPIVKRSIMAHKKAVNSIVYNHMLGLLLSSGNDHVIYIRKFFDFEILACVDIGSCFVYEMKIRNGYLYTLMYNDYIKQFNMKVFTLNGIEVCESEGDLINGFDIDDDGRVLVGYYNNVIKVYRADMKVVEKEIDLYEERKKKGIIEKEGESVFKGFLYVKKVGVVGFFSTSEVMKIDV